MLQTSTVKESTLELLRKLQAEPLEGMLVQQMLVEKYGFLPTVIAENTLIGFIQGVKIDVIYHPIIKMTDTPDKVYATAPLKKN